MPSARLTRRAGFLAVAALLAASGCSRHAEPTMATTASKVSGPSRPDGRRGVIAAIRPAVRMVPSGPREQDVRGSILRAIGPTPAGATLAAADAPVEFIVREDGGDTISVVQADGDRLRPGERVTLVPGAPIRLARAAGG